MKNRDFIILLLSGIVLYVLGNLAYQPLYRFTIFSVKSLSNVYISFYGKYPWFGNPKFSLLLASNAPLVFLTSKILTKFLKPFQVAFFIYVFFFIISYIFYCWFVGFGLQASNDFYKSGDELSYNLRQVNMNEVFGITIVLTTLSTTITLVFINIFKKRRTDSQHRFCASEA